MKLEGALAELKAAGVEADAARAAAYHKAPRVYLGVRNPIIYEMVKRWRGDMDVPGRVELARDLWNSDVHEAMVAAANLLTQARIRDDDAVWRLVASWVPGLDAWAVADHAAGAGSRRLTADPSRLDEVEAWTGHENFWVRRAALVFTLPWAKQNFPKRHEREARERILGWAASYVDDREWFIQKAVAWWLRDLSKRDPDRVRAFLHLHGEAMKAFARKEAGKYLET